MANGFPLHSHFSQSLASASLALAISFSAVAEEEENARRIGYIFEGSFESYELQKVPDGAQGTLLVPYYEWDYGVRSFTRKVWEERKLTWEKFDPIAKKLADKLVEKVEPEVVRDERGVVEYVIIEDKDPFMTSILISDKLHPKFRDALGDRIHVLVIDRNLIYLFPAVGGKLKNYGASIVDDFRAAKLPVSVEVFLLDKNGYRAVGELSREPGGQTSF